MKEVIKRLTKEEVIQKKYDVCNAIIMNPSSVTKALEQAGVSHSTYYKWKAEDPTFGMGLDHWENARTDFVEGCLMKRCADGSDSLIKFYLETKGKDRGYDKVRKIETTVTQTNVISMPAISPDEWDSLAVLQQKALGSDKELTIDVTPDEVTDD